MGETHSLLAPLFTGSTPEGFVRRTVTTLRDHGFDTVRDGGNDHVASYEVDHDDVGLGDEPPLEAVAEEVAREGGTIRMWFDGYGVRVSFAPDDEYDDWMYTPVWLGGLREHAFDEDTPIGTARDRADRLADAIAALAEEFDPWLVVGRMRHPYDDGGVYPDGRPPESGIEKLGWVTVFGEEWYDRFGGLERMLDAPAWAVRELDNGAVFVRQGDVPRQLHPDAESSGEPSTYEYLFDRASLDELEAEVERQKNTYLDPFRDLEDGELASDPVMCEAHAPFEWEEMDYSGFPDIPDTTERCHLLCVRREGDKLWEANNGEFVRRLVDEDGQPIGELPEGVPPHREMISLAITTAYDGDGSLDTYRMEGPDDSSILAQVLGLQLPEGESIQRVPEGESIWQDRDDPVTRQF